MKLFKTTGITALIFAIIPAVTSCKSDEPANLGDAGNSVFDNDGQRITSIGKYYIEYDEKGRVVEVEDDYYGEDIEIDYKNGKIYLEDSEGSIKFNEQGLITEISASWEEIEEDNYDIYEYKGSGTLKFSYDGSGYLTSSSSSSKSTDKNLTDKYTIKYESSYSTSFKWNRRNLVSARFKGTEDEDGDKYKWDTEYTVEYSDEENEFLQLPFTLLDNMIVEQPVSVLGCVGLFGKGPANLPYLLVEDYSYESDGEDYSDSEITSLNFGVNSNGTISWERNNYNTYNYSYGFVRSTRDKIRSDKKFSFRKLFPKHRLEK